MLEAREVKVKFGGLTAVNNFSLTVEKGTIHSLIGPNGAGKTTLFNSITKVGPITSGSILYKGEDITSLPSYKIIYKGIARTFQNLQLFAGMTVFENLYSGYAHTFRKPFPSIFTGVQRPFEKQAREKVAEVAKLFGLSLLLGYYPQQLSYGLLKRVEIARALISGPELLLLDEPAAGLNQEETEEIDAIFTGLKNQGITILLVEHDMNIVMKISDKVTVMNFGNKIAEGTPAQISRDPEVIRVYLGEAANA